MKPISYRDKLNNKRITEFFGVEDGDTFQDKKEDDVLGDYDTNKYNDEEDNDKIDF